MFALRQLDAKLDRFLASQIQGANALPEPQRSAQRILDDIAKLEARMADTIRLRNLQRTQRASHEQGSYIQTWLADCYHLRNSIWDISKIHIFDTAIDALIQAEEMAHKCANTLDGDDAPQNLQEAFKHVTLAFKPLCLRDMQAFYSQYPVHTTFTTSKVDPTPLIGKFRYVMGYNESTRQIGLWGIQQDGDDYHTIRLRHRSTSFEHARDIIDAYMKAPCPVWIEEYAEDGRMRLASEHGSFLISLEKTPE
jgi:hypothetical protein